MNNIINFKDINSDNYMKALVELLNEYTDAYNKGEPKVSDQEWDRLYFELICCEKELGHSLPNSPTQIIHYNTIDILNKVKHNHKMLSLDKTKEVKEIIDFINDKETIAMCKMDGLTCSLHYINGRLVGAETRGDGFIGEDILHNAMIIPSIPNNIPYFDELIVDGEIICETDIFSIYFAEEYAHVRNFASGSIRLLDSKECESRKLKFVAWDVIKGLDNVIYLNKKLEFLKNYGFYIVPYLVLPFTHGEEYIETNINILINNAKKLHYPIDGIVFKFNHVEYGRSLGETAHHFKNAIAYKFGDDTYETELCNIEWTMGRSGILTPIAIFKPVDIDGTKVSRASLHNLNIMEEVLGRPYKGQKVWVSKRNMIIPQIEKADKENLSDDIFNIPKKCPICGEETEIREDNDTIVLYCRNPSCEGKLINRLDHFCGKKGLDIKGLSKATLEKLIDWGWISNISDIMILSQYRNEWIKKPGFGPKSVDKILNAIEYVKVNTTLDSFISALGIPLIGKTVSKELIKHISTYEEFREKVDNEFDFSVYDGFAESKTAAIWNYNFEEADKVYSHLVFKEVEKAVSNNKCEGMKIAITGNLDLFKNRSELKKKIEECGGKVVDSVSKNTDCVICNNSSSNTAKINTAKKLFIPIIDEKTFFEKYLTF